MRASYDREKNARHEASEGTQNSHLSTSDATWFIFANFVLFVLAFVAERLSVLTKKSWISAPAVYKAGDIPGAETIVDIHNNDIGGAAV
jgi:heme/copper-type cytochrome/quinol oxidase subunit 3